jgi:HEAT repeat protein
MPKLRSRPLAPAGGERAQIRFWRALAFVALGVCAYLLWRAPSVSATTIGAGALKQSTRAWLTHRASGARAGSSAAPSLAHLLAAVDRAGSVPARCLALSRLARSRDAEAAAVARIVDFTEPGQPLELRSCATAALGEVLSAEALPALIELAADPWVMLAEQALRALAQRDEPEAREAMLSVARRGAPAARVAAAVALAEAEAPEAIALLVELLKLAPSHERERLVLALGSTHDPRALGVLLGLLGQGGSLVHAAITALGELGGQAATRTLLRLFRERPPYANSVLHALARSRDPEARAALLAAAEDGAPHGLASAALQALQTLEGQDVHAVMQRALASQHPERVGVAVEYLASHADADGVEALAELAQRGGQRFAPQALYALARIGGDEAREVVTELASAGGQLGDAALGALSTMPEGADDARALALEQLKNGAARPTPHALDLLGRDGSDQARSALISIAERPGPASSQAVMLLAQRGDPESRAVLERIASKEGPVGQRGPALFALAQVGGPDAAKTLRGALSSEQPAIRAQAVQALAQSGGAEVEQDLIGATRDRDREVASAAVGALVQLGTPGALERLAQVASSSDTQMARQALMSLSSVDPARGASIAERLAASSDAAARQTALTAIGTLPEATATRIVVSALRDSDPAVVAEALTNLGAAGFVEAAARPALNDLARDARVPAELRERAQQVLSGSYEATGHEMGVSRSFR